MDKEKITIEAIKQDLYKLIKWKLSIKFEWRFCYIIPITTIAIILGLVFRREWIGMIVFSVAAYHIVCYLIAFKDFLAKKRAIKATVTRDDIYIFVERFRHVATESIYEPHMGHRRALAIKEVRIYRFHSLMSWRDPIFGSLYDWSEERSIDSRLLYYSSNDGDEFYYVSLKGYQDVAYIYPCKFFDLDSSLKN